MGSQASLERALHLHGDRTSSFNLIQDSFQSFYDSKGGIIRYVETGQHWIAANEPLTQKENRIDSWNEFKLEAQSVNKSAICTPVSMEFARQISETSRSDVIKVGEEPIFELDEYFYAGMDPLISFPRARALRRNGAVVREVDSREFLQNPKFRDMIDRQDSGRSSAPLKFLSEFKPFDRVEQKRVFALELGGKTSAFLIAIPVPSLSDYYIERIIRQDSVRSGTSELLTIETFGLLRKEGVKNVRMGISALAGLNEQPGWFGRLGRVLFQQKNSFYNFAGNYRFKEKLNPTRWESLYLIHSEKFGLRGLYDLFRAHLPGRVFTKRPKLADSLITALRPGVKVPKSQTSLTSRLKVTLGITAAAVALHLFKITSSLGYQVFESLQFDPTNWKLSALMFGPFFHNTTWHLLGDVFTLLVFLGAFEWIAGSRKALITACAGLFLTNPITAGILENLLPAISNAQYDLFLSKKDVGISNAVYSAAASLAALIAFPSWILVPMGANALVYIWTAKKLLAFHHVVALGLGYVVGRMALKEMAKKKAATSSPSKTELDISHSPIPQASPSAQNEATPN